MVLHDRDTADARPPDQERFWHLYLQEHQRPWNCWLHVIGTTSSWPVLVAAVTFRSCWLLILMPVVGNGSAWLGHLLVEDNRPTSMRFPVRSLLADDKLTSLMMTGRNRQASTVGCTACPSSDTTSHTAELEKL